MGWKRRPLWLRHSRVNLDIHDSTIVEPRAEKADPPSANPTSMDLENHLAQLRFNLDDADIRDNTNIELQLENKASPSAKICTLPEELRQEIISYLNYVDAWSLKQTSKLFLQVNYCAFSNFPSPAAKIVRTEISTVDTRILNNASTIRIYRMSKLTLNQGCGNPNHC